MKQGRFVVQSLVSVEGRDWPNTSRRTDMKLLQVDSIDHGFSLSERVDKTTRSNALLNLRDVEKYFHFRRSIAEESDRREQSELLRDQVEEQ